MDESAISVQYCAACGKGEGGHDDLKRCNRCKQVKYCSVTCQRSLFYPKHKKACRKRAAELWNESLHQPQNPNEDCPICFLPLPLHVTHKMYMNWCGKELCLGYIHATDELTADGGEDPCPFCRTPAPEDIEEWNFIMERRMRMNDFIAFNSMGNTYLCELIEFVMCDSNLIQCYLFPKWCSSCSSNIFYFCYNLFNFYYFTDGDVEGYETDQQKVAKLCVCPWPVL